MSSFPAIAASLAAWARQWSPAQLCDAAPRRAELYAVLDAVLDQAVAAQSTEQRRSPAEALDEDVERVAAELARSGAALAAVPCAIVHGRHDVICPPAAAARLHAAWPGSALRIVEGGAHALFEKPMRAAAQASLAELVAARSGEGGKRRRGED